MNNELNMSIGTALPTTDFLVGTINFINTDGELVSIIRSNGHKLTTVNGVYILDGKIRTKDTLLSDIRLLGIDYQFMGAGYIGAINKDRGHEHRVLGEFEQEFHTNDGKLVVSKDLGTIRLTKGTQVIESPFNENWERTTIELVAILTKG